MCFELPIEATEASGFRRHSPLELALISGGAVGTQQLWTQTPMGGQNDAKTPRLPDRPVYSLR